MIIKGLIDEDFVNYKKSSMFIVFPNCTFKCDKECGRQVCQNSALANTECIEISIDKIIKRYINNPITKSIVLGGLEPFDSWSDLYEFIKELRTATYDDIVIYTGYFKHEIEDKIALLLTFKNIIIKYGRFIPKQKNHYDEILGVYLASNNQYAEKIS